MSAITSRKCTVAELNALGTAEFVSFAGGVYENSPWIAAAAAAQRPFGTCDELAGAMDEIVAQSGADRQLELIRAHPDLAGRLAAPLTDESRREQAAAGLDGAAAETIERVRSLNKAYRARFGFPFVLCARLNKVSAILEAMENRLKNPAAAEIETALAEISKIARLRLADLIVN